MPGYRYCSQPLPEAGLGEAFSWLGSAMLSRTNRTTVLMAGILLAARESVHSRGKSNRGNDGDFGLRLQSSCPLHTQWTIAARKSSGTKTGAQG